MAMVVIRMTPEMGGVPVATAMGFFPVAGRPVLRLSVFITLITLFVAIHVALSGGPIALLEGMVIALSLIALVGQRRQR